MDWVVMCIMSVVTDTLHQFQTFQNDNGIFSLLTAFRHVSQILQNYTR